MPGLLHSANTSVITCSHGGLCIPIPSQARVLLGSQPALTNNDFFTISGCSFTVGGKLQPCVDLKWLNASKRILINGNPALLFDSFSLCHSAEQVFQGISISVQSQGRVRGF